MIIFKPFFDTLQARGIRQSDLIQSKILGAQQLYNMRHNGSITTATIDALCKALNCKPWDIIEYVPDPPAD